MTGPIYNWRDGMRRAIEDHDRADARRRHGAYQDEPIFGAYYRWAARHEKLNVLLGLVAAGAFGFLCGLAVRW